MSITVGGIDYSTKGWVEYNVYVDEENLSRYRKWPQVLKSNNLTHIISVNLTLYQALVQALKNTIIEVSNQKTLKDGLILPQINLVMLETLIQTPFDIVLLQECFSQLYNSVKMFNLGRKQFKDIIGLESISDDTFKEMVLPVQTFDPVLIGADIIKFERENIIKFKKIDQTINLCSTLINIIIDLIKKYVKTN